MTIIRGDVKLKHQHFKYPHLVQHWRPPAARRDHLSRGLAGRISLADNTCGKETRTEEESDVTDSLARLQLPLHFHYDFSRVRATFPPRSPAVCRPQVPFWRPAERPSDKDRKGKAQRESSSEARTDFPRCSWLPAGPEDLSERFQNKEFVCEGAQIASPRMYAHSQTETRSHRRKTCYSNSFWAPVTAAAFCTRRLWRLLRPHSEL